MGRKNTGNEASPVAVANSFDPSALVASGAGPATAPASERTGSTPSEPESSDDALKTSGEIAHRANQEAHQLEAAARAIVAVDQTISLTVPLAERSGGYESSRVEIYGLTEKQSAALDRLTAALRIDNARCQKRIARTPDGLVVDTPADAIRWLLDRIDEAA